MATIYIHIGGAKCGSSSIQYFLESNRKSLLEQKVVVPDTKLQFQGENLGQQIWFYENLNSQGTQESQKLILKRIMGLLKTVDNDENAKIILSAENLSNRQGFHKLFAMLRNNYDTKIILYARRQDDYLISAWQQWYVKSHNDFWTWLIEVIKLKGDWMYCLEPWISTYGSDSVIVRRFGRSYFPNGNLIEDFCGVTGIDMSNLDLSAPERNVGFNDSITDIAASVRDIFKDIHDNEFYDMIGNWGGGAVYKIGPSQVMSVSQRRSLMSYYKESNDKMKALFFPELTDDEDLFEPIRNRGFSPSCDDKALKQIEILTRLLYGSYKETKKLKEMIEAAS